MRKSLAALIFAVSVGLAMPLAAQERPQLACGQFTEMRAKLKSDFNETEVGTGVITDKVILVIYASPNGETWTALSVGADGSACFLSAGRAWTGLVQGDPA